MMIPKKRQPTHPGEMLLKEFLEPLELSQKELAAHLGWPYARLNEIIHGKRGLTPESCLALGEAFEIEPEFWLNLQSNYALWHAAQEHKKIGKLKKSHKAKAQALRNRNKNKRSGRSAAAG